MFLFLENTASSKYTGSNDSLDDTNSIDSGVPEMASSMELSHESIDLDLSAQRLKAASLPRNIEPPKQSGN